MRRSVSPASTASSTDVVPREDEAVASRKWWRDAVIYQVYPRSFADGNGDGVGDIIGLRQRLDHLVRLGVGAIWLCPVYPSPGRDNGYDVSDYTGIDPLFGTLSDFTGLVADAHELGLRVVLDVVVNHTSDEHPWFIASRDARAREHDWYIWRPPRAGYRGGEPGAEPNNWRAAFGGSAWTWDPDTGKYYLGVFSSVQPDLNWENPDLRQQVFEMMRIWLDRGVDGFRLDVINLIDKPQRMDTDDDLNGTAVEAAGRCQNGPRLRTWLTELRREVLKGRDDILLLGETPGVGPELAAQLADPDQGPLDMVLQFEHSELDRHPARWQRRKFDLLAFKSWAQRWQTGHGARTWSALFLSNHDQARIVSRYGDPQWWARSATLWAAVLHAHRGTPFIFQGDEIGMTNFPFDGIEDFADIEAHGVFSAAVAEGVDPEAVLTGLRALSRDNARTPFQWDGSPGGGFTTSAPWLPINPNHSWLNVAAQEDQDDSILAFYRALVSLRHTHPAMSEGTVSVLLPAHPTVYALERTHATERLLLVANVSSAPAPWPDSLQAWMDADLLLTNTDIEAPHTRAPGRELGPWETKILRSA